MNFSSGNLISIADVDAGSSSIQLSLYVFSGTLTLSGTTGLTFTTGDGTSDASMTFTGTLANINTALNGLTYTPNANYNGSDSMYVYTSDLGNTGSGGTLTDFDAVSITVNSVNDAPAGTNNTVSTNEDTAYTFSTGNFGFSDSSDSPANNFSSVKITSLPGAGTLAIADMYSSTPVTLGQFVTVSDINSGKLKYTPAANGNGTGYTSFTFQVKDDGGTSNGGVDLDASANTMTIDVAAVNDAPVNSMPGSQTTNNSTNLVFSSANGNLISITDVDAGSSSIQVSLTVMYGSLSLNGTSGLTFSSGSGSGYSMTFTGTLADINAALDGMTYIPPGSGYSMGWIYLSTNDLGNTGSGGALSDYDSLSITLTA